MSNAGQFKSGSEWRGNSNGRPRGTGKDIRIQLNSEMVKSHAPIYEKVLMDLAIEARDGKDQGLKRWYIKEFKEYFYGKPKTEIEIGDARESPDLSGVTDPALAEAYKILSGVVDKESGKNG